jgi:hypothetical protein
VALRLITRAQWKAKAPKARKTLDASQIDELVIHYTAMASDQVKSHADCYQRVRGTQRYHQSADPSRKKKPWADISYNFVFCHHGEIFEGRGWNVESAATLGHNGHTQAICFLGGDNTSRDDFTPEAQRAATELVREFHRRYGASRKVVGHRDRSAEGTDCPGEEIYRWIRAKGWTKKPPDPEAVDVNGFPDWVIPWVEWQLGGRDPRKRPRNAPKRVPAFAWDVARSVRRITRELQPG